jgi:hypothetical protein
MMKTPMAARSRSLFARIWLGLLGSSSGERLIMEVRVACYRLMRMLGFATPALAWSGTTHQGAPGTTALRRSPGGKSGRFQASHAVLATLQRRAVWELFGWLGLDVVPLAFWRVLDRIPDLSDALCEFIRNCQLNPDLVRRRETRELDLFRTLVLFICQLETSPGLASERQRVQLEALVYFGDYASANALRGVFVVLNEALEIYDAAPGPRHFKVFDRLADEVRRLQLHAVPLTLDEARGAVVESKRLAQSMWRYKAAADRRDEAREFIRANEASWSASVAERQRRDDVGNRVADAERSLMTDPSCNVAATLEAFALGIDQLGQMAANFACQMQGAADAAAAAEAETREKERQQKNQKAENDRRARSADGNVGIMSQDDLLVFFGFEPGAQPSLRRLREAFTAAASLCDPHRGGPDFAARTAHYRHVIDCFRSLKVALGY